MNNNDNMIVQFAPHVRNPPPMLIYDRRETNLNIDGSIVDSFTLGSALKGLVIPDIHKFKTLIIRNARINNDVVVGMSALFQRKSTTAAATTSSSSSPSSRRANTNNKNKNSSTFFFQKWEKIEIIHCAGPMVSKLIETALPYTDGFAYTGSVPLHRTRYSLDDNSFTILGAALQSSNSSSSSSSSSNSNTSGKSSVKEKEDMDSSDCCTNSSTTSATAACNIEGHGNGETSPISSSVLSPSIKSLNLKGTKLHGASFEGFCNGLASSTTLESFELAYCSLEADYVHHLSSALRRNKHLTHLVFAGCKFGSTSSHLARRLQPSSPPAAAAVAPPPPPPPPEVVVVVNPRAYRQENDNVLPTNNAAVPTGGDRADVVAGDAGDNNLDDDIQVDIQVDIGDGSSDAESIILSTNNTNPQTHFSDILEALIDSSMLQVLKISGMHTNEASMNAIGSLLSSPNSALKQLCLKNNLAQHEGILHVSPILQGLKDNSKLTNLQLTGNNINDEVADELSSILAESNTVLQGLILSSNSIGNDGFRHFARRLPNFKSLKSLDLQRNRIIDEEPRKALIASLENNVVMWRLDIDSGIDTKKNWWLTLNKAGRALLTESQNTIPPGLWPMILRRVLTMSMGRVHPITNLDVLHFFLRRGHEMFEHTEEKDQKPKQDNRKLHLDLSTNASNNNGDKIAFSDGKKRKLELDLSQRSTNGDHDLSASPDEKKLKIEDHNGVEQKQKKDPIKYESSDDTESPDSQKLKLETSKEA